MPSPLMDEIDAAIRKHERLAPLDYYLAEVFSWVGVLASVFAGLSVINEWLPRDASAIVAVIPALAWTLLRTFRYEARSNWHYRYRARLVALKRELRDQGETEPVVSKRLGELDLEMDATFPRREDSGRSSGAPAHLTSRES